MLRHIALLIPVLAAATFGAAGTAVAQPGATARPQVVWEVKNRFRLFREDKDFALHVDAMQGRDIFEAEQVLARQSEGRGWARNMLGRLCIDAAGKIAEPCQRAGEDENYLAPADHRVSVRLNGAEGKMCSWSFDNGEDAKAGFLPCEEEVTLRVRYGKATLVSVDINRGDGTADHASAEIAVRDLLIVGLGDSVAAGEGNPDRPVALSDEGFCFRRFIATTRSEYFRPGRAGFSGDKSCEIGPDTPGAAEAWNKLGAQWLNGACHRSLYSHQLRAALALAVENPRIAVTFVPLACTGATIDRGMLNPQRAREVNCGNRPCPSTVPGQIAQLRTLLETARKQDPKRQLDLVMLTIGANDIDFSGLAADAITEETSARAILKRSGVLGSVESSEDALAQSVPRDFTRLRTALKPLVGDLSRVVYVSYAHPALTADGSPCPGGREGVDIHPSFGVDGERLRRIATFVQDRFLPRLRSLATCTDGAGCTAADAFTFVDAHQESFAGHGFCARADSDPAFDNECFSPAGTSFTASPAAGATEPLACGRRPNEFRAYAPRARWIRTANDSYFAAMTYPQGSPMSPSDIHDATWGLLSAVYGGAIHPTAEGQAVMADAVVTEAERVLELRRPVGTVTVRPLPAPAVSAQ